MNDPPQSEEIAIRLRGIGKSYRIYERPIHRLWELLRPGHAHSREHRALSNINLDIRKGETFGVVGRNGSGKSTLMRIISRVVTATEGTIESKGRIAPLVALGAGFNPEFTGRENVRLNATVLGLSARDIAERFDSITDFADIGDAIDQPVRTYSSGMVARLAFSVAACVDPDILVLDEVLAVGDELFSRKCFARLESLRHRGTTILLVSHAARTILENCDRALLLEHGQVRAVGAAKDVMREYHSLLYTGTRFARDDVAETSASRAPADGEADGWFDPELLPISKAEYPSRGAVITDVAITNADGEPRNQLMLGQRYFVSYRVHFERDADQLLLGMNIGERGGVVIAGLAQPLPMAREGDVVTVRFAVDVRMLPGTYFLTVGVRSTLEEEVMHRIIDAVALRVIPDSAEVSRFGYWAIDAAETTISIEHHHPAS